MSYKIRVSQPMLHHMVSDLSRSVQERGISSSLTQPLINPKFLVTYKIR